MSTAKRVSKRQEMRSRREQGQRRQRTITLVIVALAVIAVAAIILVPMLKPPFKGMDRPQANGNSYGDPNAPVKVEEFADFQCPYCRQFAETQESALIKKYVDTGKVHFTYNSFIVIGQESIRAAEAAYCAQDQGKFWDFHDILFGNQGTENSGAMSDDKLRQFAQDVKLNMTQFNDCFNNNKYQQRVTDESNLGKTKGVNATPYFLVNDKLVDMTQLDASIDAALQGK